MHRTPGSLATPLLSSESYRNPAQENPHASNILPDEQSNFCRTTHQDSVLTLKNASDLFYESQYPETHVKIKDLKEENHNHPSGESELLSSCPMTKGHPFSIFPPSSVTLIVRTHFLIVMATDPELGQTLTF